MIFRNYLIAPDNRFEYLKNLDAHKEDKCIFCDACEHAEKAPIKIKEVPIIADFEQSFLVINCFPYVSQGHVMVVPKRHVADIDELSSDEIEEIFKEIIPKIKAVLKKEYPKTEGFNIGINMGRAAGATIEHLHVHVVPRSGKEAAFMESTAGTRIIENPEKTMVDLAKHFK